MALSREDPHSWDNNLNRVLLAWRTKVHSTTKYSPYYLMYGIDPVLPGDNPLIPPKNIEKARKEALKELEASLNVIKGIQGDNKAKVNNNPDPQPKFKLNDYVLLKNMNKRKNQFKWKGPLKVVFVSPRTLTYRLAYPSGVRLQRPINEMLLRKSCVKEPPRKMGFSTKTKQSIEDLDNEYF